MHGAVLGLSGEELAFRLDEGTNSITWLVWHLTRVQDDHVADAAGTSQVWSDDGWDRRFGLPFPAEGPRRYDADQAPPSRSRRATCSRATTTPSTSERCGT